MTFHKNSSRHSFQYQHPFRAPDEEEELAHIHITIRYALIVFGLVPVVLFLIGIWIAAHPHFTEVDPTPNTTKYIRENYHVNETSPSRIWVYWTNGGKFNIDPWWNNLFVKNQSAYVFGFGNHSFCNPRLDKSYKYTWTTSIYRASQLYASVQTGFRYGLLFVFLPMVLNSFILAKTLVIENKTFTSLMIGTLYFCNEVAMHISYFCVTTLHVEFEGSYIPYSSVYFSIAMILSMSKLMLRNFTEPIGLTTILRSVGLLIIIIAHDPLAANVQDFVDHVYCDTFVSPKVCFLELACIGILFLNNLYDVNQTQNLHLVVSQTADDQSIQKMAKKSVFRRVKVARRA